MENQEINYLKALKPKSDCLLFDLDDTLYPRTNGVGHQCDKNVQGMELQESNYLKALKPKYDCLLFDLDDTLYPRSNGVGHQCDKNVQDYMVEILKIKESDVDKLGDLLYKNYGTTMAGLKAIGYKFDCDHYHSFVHGRLPYENLKPDPVLRHLLLTIPLSKVIFTNADELHVAKVLKRLGLEDCFQEIICFDTLNPQNPPSRLDESQEIFDIIKHFDEGGSIKDLPKTPISCKPSVTAIEYALKVANIDPHKTIFFEDSVRNIIAGKSFGLHTVLVGKTTKITGADYVLESIHNMKEALPGLWEETEKTEEIHYVGDVGIETSVIA